MLWSQWWSKSSHKSIRKRPTPQHEKEMWFYKNRENSNHKNQQVSILSGWQRKKIIKYFVGEEILSCTVYESW